MRYLVLVSHGTLAPGMHSVLTMLGGPREDVMSASLEDGMGADEYIARLNEVLASVAVEDEVVLLGDIIGGSPLTNALNTISEKGLLGSTVAFGGMNLPMAMTALMGLQTASLETLAQSMLQEAHDGARQLEIAPAADDDEDDI